MPADPTKTLRWMVMCALSASCAEMTQVVAVVWVTFVLTKNATLVGIVNAAIFLPGVVLGLYFQRHADKGDAGRLLKLTNRVLVVGALGLMLVWAFSESTNLIVGAFITVQCVLSFIKLLNKAYIGRFIRDSFDSTNAAKTLSRSASFALVGGMAGGALAGVLLDFVNALWCFGISAALYLLSQVAISFAVNSAPARGARPATPLVPADSALHSSPEALQAMRVILLFSIPSAGALPFISTLTAPLAHRVAPDVAAYYSVLTVATMLGGFIAGMLLSSARVSYLDALRWTLLGGAIALLPLAFVHSALAVFLLILVVSVVLMLHAIAMQVMTNQTAPAGRVGKTTVLRNSVTGTSRGLFALAAGRIVDVCGLDSAWLFLAAVLAIFAALWLLMAKNFRAPLAEAGA